MKNFVMIQVTINSNLCLINMLMFTVLGIFSFEVSMLFEYLVITRYENNNIIR